MNIKAKEAYGIMDGYEIKKLINEKHDELLKLACFGALNPEVEKLRSEIIQLRNECDHSFCPKDLRCIYCGTLQEENTNDRK
jgi:hypothetical protein